MLKNNAKNLIPSTLSPEQLAKAIAEFDLSSIPPRRRMAALHAHLMRVARDSATRPMDRVMLADIIDSRTPRLIT